MLRDTESREVLDRVEAWVDTRQDQYPRKSKMGSALGYAIHQRAALRRFLDVPKLPLDNNLAEGALRIVALGRKNFPFAGHVEGAQNLAVLQTITSTCALHSVNPYEYIKDILIRIQHHPNNKINVYRSPGTGDPRQRSILPAHGARSRPLIGYGDSCHRHAMYEPLQGVRDMA